MARSLALMPAVLAVTIMLGCGESAGPSGLSAGTITSASAATAGVTTDASDSGSSGGPTTSDSASTAVPCEQLTLCPTTTAPEPSTGTSTTQDPLTTSTTEPSAPGDPCDGMGDGPHCGGELGGLADHSSLYQCGGGLTQAVTPARAAARPARANPSRKIPAPRRRAATASTAAAP